MFDWIRTGLRSARRHRRLVLVVYLTSLLPALLWALTAWPVFSEGLGDRPLADGLLGPEAFQVWVEYAANNGGALDVLTGLVPLLLGLTLLLQVMVSAGSMNVLARSGPGSSFLGGVARYSGRFLRSALAFGLMLLPALVVLGVGVRVGGRLAESTGNAYLRLAFTLGGLLAAGALFLLADLAYDLSRISAVARDGRQTFRGAFRALAAVLRRPARLVGAYLLYASLVAAVVLLYQVLRGSFAASAGVFILAAFVVQQLSMLTRSFLQVSFLGAELAAYRALGSAAWCRGELPEGVGAPASAPPPPAAAEPPVPAPVPMPPQGALPGS